jgi:hypothetical protein
MFFVKIPIFPINCRRGAGEVWKKQFWCIVVLERQACVRIMFGLCRCMSFEHSNSIAAELLASLENQYIAFWPSLSFHITGLSF